ncbi:reverse transcriptase [Gossypium australe]|uniref:Reverse transcriptase n=1 Tax=Gossypium australe TaxID=47621 RepID=A0A5B6UWN3_9ROSI|nr:reverse transcriptase [Gossypium australe]
MMLKMGFAISWVELIMRCINSVSYSVVINGKKGQRFTPTRGLRQRDPLSPYLFLICNEGLFALMRLASSPKISHLLFTYDCILFGTKFLSHGRKETFIKSVLQAISTYTMTFFLIPKTFCNELESFIVNFWWLKGHRKRGIH